MFGNRIKQLREESKLKQEELAKKLCVSPSAIGMYERNLREPNHELTIRIADFFNVSIDYLLGTSPMRCPNKLALDDIDIAFATGIKGLNETNQKALLEIMNALYAKQTLEEQLPKKTKMDLE